jgi:starch-binding outer membrane protein, SusD/RagB family
MEPNGFNKELCSNTTPCELLVCSGTGDGYLTNEIQKYKQMKTIVIFFALLFLLSGCEDVLTPANENIRDLDAMYKEPGYAQGILGNAYILLPYSSTPNSDVATDDAVSNDNANGYMKMATGTWTSTNNPVSQWQNRRNAIQYLNIFLNKVDDVVWSSEINIRKMFNDRLKGEAYALRAVQMFYLLMAHGGPNEAGELLGVPIVTEPESTTSNFNLPRNTFQECLDQIFADLDMAQELLPLDFEDVASSSQIPAKYQAIGVTEASEYNRVNGKHMRGRVTGRIAEAIRAQVALLAASPAFSTGNDVEWQDAANYAATVIDRIGGAAGLAPKGGVWYTKDEVDGLASGVNPAEILWRDNVGTSNTLEADNFPPSLYGKGRVNPSQNLVDAFPAINGYPITAPESGFDPSNPYANRDPRLATYIVLNESKMGPNSSTIVTGTYSDVNDPSIVDNINKEAGYSTRTGYYLRKLLRPDCNPDPNFNTTQKHFTARIRYTEIFLAYAEAANEAWGPTGNGGHAYSAFDVIKAIRSRAGITGSDQYLIDAQSDKDKMRELIRNERRLELCFENIRFWDLRRWKVDMSKLNETARGLQIDKNNNVLSYTTINAEIRDFKDYMYYGPIPNGELRKWDQLEQNAGW